MSRLPFKPVAVVPCLANRELGQLQGLSAGGRRDRVPHCGASPEGRALRQALPHAWIY